MKKDAAKQRRFVFSAFGSFLCFSSEVIGWKAFSKLDNEVINYLFVLFVLENNGDILPLILFAYCSACLHLDQGLSTVSGYYLWQKR